MKVSDNIKRLRKERHMTQQQLADAIGVHVVTLQSYEAGKYVPKYSVLLKLSSALGVPVSEIDHSQQSDVVVIDAVKHRLDVAFNKLNDDGKESVVRYAEDLTTQEKYRK